MALRAVEQVFTGATTPISSYDSTKTNLGTLMIQNSGTNPDDNFVGPFPIAIARPLEESTPIAMFFPHAITFSSMIDWVFLIENAANAAKRIFLYEYNKLTSTYNWKGFITATLPNATNVTRGFRMIRSLHTTGTVAVAAPVSYYSAGTSVALAVTGVVTGVGTTFTSAMVGKMIGFGSTNVALINCWYPIITFTSTTSITVSGASSVIAASANYVIASCSLTGTGTRFVTDRVAAGTSVTGVAGGLGPRIGFGSTDPTQITQWYQIGAIASDTSLNLTTSPGIVAAGTPYVIEELNFAIMTTNTTTTNGGLMMLKGVGYSDFTTAGSTFPSIASNLDAQRGVYWMQDMPTITNISACGLALDVEISKNLQYVYCLDGIGSTYMRVYRYNLRATGTVTTGKIALATSYYTTGTASASGTAVTGSGTTFTANMVGLRIGFGSTSPALITTWYTIASFTSTTAITLTSSAGTVTLGDYIIDSADIISTGNQLVTGTVVGVNNGRLGTLNHGPGAGVQSIYFVTSTRIYRAAVSNIYAGNLAWISDNRIEVPPGGTNTWPATAALACAEIADSIDRLIVLTTGATAFKSYVTRYPAVSGEQFDAWFGVDDKQQDQSLADSNIAIHYNTASQQTSIWAQNGVAHIIKHGTTAALCQLYAIPVGAHWLYASSTNQQVITPALSTPDCTSFQRVLTTVVDHLGAEQFRMPTASVLVYYRTNGITDNSGTWTLADANGDLSGLAPASTIQFMFQFVTFGLLSIAGRVLSLAVLYNDNSTDSHYQPSNAQTVPASKQFAWRFSNAFGGTVPKLRIRLYDAVTDGVLVDDDSVTQSGTWEKSTNDGGSWAAYNTTDMANNTTYIRYTPATLPNNIKVRPLLTQY
jgi:hypothetical protein